MRLTYSVVNDTPGFEVSPQDREALERIVSWAHRPTFFTPGRTAWHVLSTPVVDPATSRTLVAAKIKGVGAWHPCDGAGSAAATPPATTAYAATTRNHHFGVDGSGCFAPV